MAVNIVQHIAPIAFLSELRRIELDCLGKSSVYFQILMGELKAQRRIFSATYYPDNAGKVTIYDIDRVLESYVEGEPCREVFRFIANGVELVSPWFAEGSPEARHDCRLLPCRSEVNIPANMFVEEYFLTTAMEERDICPGRYEYLSYYLQADDQFVTRATYFNGTELITRDFLRNESAGYGYIKFRPDEYEVEELGQLVSLVIGCGNRIARFRVRRDLPEPDPSILFRNSFGGLDVVHFLGTKSNDTKITRSTVSVARRMTVYDVTEEPEITAMTGFILRGLEPVVEDLARSREVYLINDSGEPEEIVVTDQDLKYDNDDSTLSNLKITYRRVMAGGRIEAYRQPRIFDKYFDRKFE